MLILALMRETGGSFWMVLKLEPLHFLDRIDPASFVVSSVSVARLWRSTFAWSF